MDNLGSLSERLRLIAKELDALAWKLGQISPTSGCPACAERHTNVCDYADSEDLHVLRSTLARRGIVVTTCKRGRTTAITVMAKGSASRKVSTVTIPSEREQVPGVRARVYSTNTRHGGVPQFTVSGFNDPDRRPDLYFFILTPEKRVWMICGAELAGVDAELRLGAKGQRGRHRFGKPGFAPMLNRPGYLRVWMPQGADDFAIERHMPLSGI